MYISREIPLALIVHHWNFQRSWPLRFARLVGFLFLPDSDCSLYLFCLCANTIGQICDKVYVIAVPCDLQSVHVEKVYFMKCNTFKEDQQCNCCFWQRRDKIIERPILQKELGADRYSSERVIFDRWYPTKPQNLTGLYLGFVNYLMVDEALKWFVQLLSLPVCSFNDRENYSTNSSYINVFSTFPRAYFASHKELQ